MRIMLNDASVVDDLLATLRRSNCPADKVSACAVEVSSPSPLLTERQARVEICFYLAAWRVRHPDVELTVVD